MKKDRVISEVFGAESVLTPSEIYAQRFPKHWFRGYDPEAVDEFLHRIADTVEMLVDRIQRLKEKVEEQNRLIEFYRQEESILRNALNSAQKLNEDIIESAQRQAESILAEAQTRAQQIPLRLEQEIQHLIHLRDRFYQEVKTMLVSFQSLLAEYESNQIKNITPETKKSILDEMRKSLDEITSLDLPRTENIAPLSDRTGEGKV